MLFSRFPNLFAGVPVWLAMAWVAVLAMPAPPAHADEPTRSGESVQSSEPSRSGDPSLTVHVDLAPFSQSKLGGLLIKAGIQLAASEMEKDPSEATTAVVDMIGFDPVKQKARLTVELENLEEPLGNITATLTAKETTGNLEGLLLAVPGYSSSTHGEQTIHAVTPDDEQVFVSFDETSEGEKRVMAATSIDDLHKMLAVVPPASLKMPADFFASVTVHRLPKDALGPQTEGVTKLLQSMEMRLGQMGTDLSMQFHLVASDEEKANQLRKLVQGAVAMVGLFKEELGSELGDEETAKEMLAVIDQINVTREGSTVIIRTQVPEEIVIQFLHEEADLPL